MKLIAAMTFSLLFGLAQAQHMPVRQFGFKGVMLDAPYENVPINYKADCSSGSDKRFVFCTQKEQLEDIPVVIEITFVDRRVSEIAVFYPSSHHQDIWLALREKHGKEDERRDDITVWYASKPSPDNPMPDELTLVKVTTQQPPVTGGALSDSQHGVLQYISMAPAREAYNKRLRDMQTRVKQLSGQL
ncbi:MAG: hypothetical protein HZB72_01520 [Burkholderiales bacterium]|nr:hypothetical protein [Burkholderiales bacterium]